MSRLSISISPDDHVQGDPTAGCSLVEYGDYECPSCSQIQPVIKRLQRHFGKRLSFVFRNFPLSEMHPWAEAAAETAEFADTHGKFWEMHDLLFQNQAVFSETLLLGLACGVDDGYRDERTIKGAISETLADADCRIARSISSLCPNNDAGDYQRIQESH